MIRSKSIPLLILIVTSLGIGLGIGYWSGTLQAPEDDEYVRQDIWWLGTEIVKDDVNGQWNISTTLENRGCDNATVVLINLNREASITGQDTDLNIFPSAIEGNVTVSPLPMPINGVFSYGEIPPNGTITLTMKYDTLGYTSGTTIEVIYHTSAGVDYPLFVTLP